MQNDPKVIAKAKNCIRRYRMHTAIIYALIWVVFLLLVSQTPGILGIWVLGLCVIFALRKINKLTSQKYIFSVLSEELDADTFLATVYRGHFDTPTALWQLSGEYYCGHYQNAISICKLKLADAKLNKRFQYFYFTYLANVYFDMGDDEKLLAIYEEYSACLAKETDKKQKSCRKQFPRMVFYDMYLRQDWNVCNTWVNVPQADKLTRYHRTFCKAKLAFLQHNEEKAREYLEALSTEVPQLNYGKLSASALDKLVRQEEAPFSNLMEISQAPAEVTLYPLKHRKLLQTLFIVLLTLYILFNLASIIISLVSLHP
jgi:hypothetical protein